MSVQDLFVQVLPCYIPFIDYIVASKIRLLLHFVYLLDAFCIRLLAMSYACVEIFQSLVAFPSKYKIDRCLFNKMNSLCLLNNIKNEFIFNNVEKFHVTTSVTRCCNIHMVHVTNNIIIVDK